MDSEKKTHTHTHTHKKKSKDIENGTLFFLQITKLIHYTLRAIVRQK